jgi:hypothetical protein
LKVPGFVPNCDSVKEKKLYSAVKAEKPLIEEQQANFFKAVSESKEVTKGFGMLANCMSGMKLELSQFQNIWERYSEIWTVDREATLHKISLDHLRRLQNSPLTT